MLIDPRTNQPFYVGKGKNNRMLCHEREARNRDKYPHRTHHDAIREIIESGLSIIYQKVLINVSEREALKEERRLIECYGRKCNNTGILLNAASGGVHGGSSGKPVLKYTLDGEFIVEYPSIAIASEHNTGATLQYISAVCRGKARSAGGFLWTFKDAEAPIYLNLHYRSVVMYTHLGKYVKNFQSVSDAASELDVTVSTISSACSGKSIHCGGFLFRYEGDHVPCVENLKTPRKRTRKVKQMNLLSEVICTYDTLSEASKLSGVGITNIYNACSPKYTNRTAGGFIWEYVD